MILALTLHARAALLMEEGFNYPVGTGLAANPPWAGLIGTSVGVVGGHLLLSNFQDIVPAGNMLQIGGGGGLSAYRNFSDNPVIAAPGTAVYFSALVNCTVPPTNSQFIACFMEAGANSASPPDDPLDLYLAAGVGGCRLGVSSGGSDRATASKVLTANTTHLIVMKYTFGALALAGIYIDPTPGGLEPAFPDAQTGQGDDDGGGTGAANLQVVLLHSPSFATQGSFNLDTLRIGTTWADVTPQILLPSVTGPQNQAVCAGSPVVFNVTAAGAPPLNYQWRMNGAAIAGATNSSLALLSPTSADSLNRYDVVVSDSFGSVTSQVASFTISRSAPSILTPPSSQMVVAGISNVTFSVSAAGDPPLSLQWFTNGVPVPGATNNDCTLATTNLGSSAATNTVAVVVSNPCGSATSPFVGVYFPNVFYAAFDAGAGFFSGENFILTNASGLAFSVWSSPDPSLAVSGWTLEGPMSELPLGTTGASRYGITLNPVTSPVYYIFAQSNLPPYPPTQWVTCLTTPDFATYFAVSTNIGISTNGILAFPGPPTITQQPQSQTVLAGQSASFNVTATGPALGYLWLSNNAGIPGASAPILLLTNVSTANAGAYAVIVTNALGSVTSSIANLSVALPPNVNLSFVAPGTIQVSATSITGVTYVVQSATNLTSPVWRPILTNNTGNAGVVNLQTNTAGAVMQFYRLIFP